MVHGELFQTYLNRLEEARLYFEQGLGEGAADVFKRILTELDDSDLPENDKNLLTSRIQSELKKVNEYTGTTQAALESARDDGATHLTEPSEVFHYGMALMDGQFWDEAIREFKKATVLGYQMMECWELCGDCACRLEKWDEAIGYYEIIYSHPDVPEDLRKKVLAKITKCSQTQRKKDVRKAIQGKPEAPKGANGSSGGTEAREKKVEFIATTVTSLDESSANQLVGQRIVSCRDEKGEYPGESSHTYLVLNVLHVGLSSLIFELEMEETGVRFAGQILTGKFNQFLSPRALMRWTRTQRVMDSRYLVKVFDLAHLEDRLFIVREHMPLTLVDVLSMGEAMPIPLATYLAYQVLEGLGDLHLHMGRDESIRRIFHLDLRPSRILLHENRPWLKINNGGLWKELEESNPGDTAIQRLPLPFLAYRAPEQFRPYLGRRKLPVFTDIYLFGAIFYEMLTGSPAFQASSYEEYEIQHCEQYPTPPKVWRPQIPEQLNNIVMKCLECDPTKRWRSSTELALILEKTFSNSMNPARDESFIKYLGRCKKS